MSCVVCSRTLNCPLIVPELCKDLKMRRNYALSARGLDNQNLHDVLVKKCPTICNKIFSWFHSLLSPPQFQSVSWILIRSIRKCLFSSPYNCFQQSHLFHQTMMYSSPRVINISQDLQVFVHLKTKLQNLPYF